MQATTDSRPVHRVYVDGFWMDSTEVTNGQFAKFVEATGYVTIAERTPRAEDFPAHHRRISWRAPSSSSPPDHAVPLNDHLQWWSYVKRANWRHPEGPASQPDGPGAVPRRAGRLRRRVALCEVGRQASAHEAEWEFAATRGSAASSIRGATSSRRRPGDGEHFQDTSLTTTRSEDGTTASDLWRSSPPNGYGLYRRRRQRVGVDSDWYRRTITQLAVGGRRGAQPAPGRTRRSIPASHLNRSACIAVARSSAPTNTVHATW
jgi:formylglycine-generating enzyme required for sulfatase activity